MNDSKLIEYSNKKISISDTVYTPENDNSSEFDRVKILDFLNTNWKKLESASIAEGKEVYFVYDTYKKVKCSVCQGNSDVTILIKGEPHNFKCINCNKGSVTEETYCIHTNILKKGRISFRSEIGGRYGENPFSYAYIEIRYGLLNNIPDDCDVYNGFFLSKKDAQEFKKLKILDLKKQQEKRKKKRESIKRD